MKRFFLSYPKSMADEISKFIGENELVTLSSWMEVSGMFGDTKTIVHTIAVPEAKADMVAAKYHKIIIEKL